MTSIHFHSQMMEVSHSYHNNSDGLEEKLREAACVGDLEAVTIICDKGVNVNDQHAINGWTALHWASRRCNSTIVSYLLSHGADKSIKTYSGETAAMVTDSKAIKLIIEGSSGESLRSIGPSSLPMRPHYLDNQPVGYTVDVGKRMSNSHSKFPVAINGHITSTDDELVLKVRQAQLADKDFIEVEIPRSDLTYVNLLKICSAELGVDAQCISRVRKLPNTMLRKDKDVQRLKDFQEIEIVTGQNHCLSSSSFGSSALSTQSVFGPKTTILY